MQKNVDIRTTARIADVKHWEIAEVLGVSEITFSRWLRKELSADKKEKIKQAIKQIVESRP